MNKGKDAQAGSRTLSWFGPPGCTCDLTRPPRDRCTKGGWHRCQGALNAMLAQIHYRNDVGKKGGVGKRTFIEIVIQAQKKSKKAR
jgi:hypothetical protein